MSKQIGIYKIISPIGRIYIGQSINIQKRWKDYIKYNKFSGQKRLRNSVKKYGWNKHIFSVVEECDVHELNNKERYWQDYYSVLGYKGLNCKLTKSDDKSGELNSSTKNKISSSLIGKQHSEQRRENQRKAQIGKIRTLEHKKALSEAVKQRFTNLEERLKQGKKLQKVVIQYDMNNNFIKEWPSTREVERILNIDRATISSCCNQKRGYKSAGGFKWRYKAIEEALKLIL